MKQLNLIKRPCLFLRSIYLRNFRNYEEAEIAFGPSLNVIFGNNAQGKTNLLEAISILSTGRSFRTQHLSEMIKEGQSFFYLEAEVIRDQISHQVKIFYDGKTKKLQLNATEFSSFAPLLGTFPSIFCLPDDIDLITDAPSYRRKFLNLHLAQSDPLYVHHLARFWRAMKQRNCLLKAKKDDTLDYWEEEMSLSSQYIYEKRTQLLDQLKQTFDLHNNQLSKNRENVEIVFLPTYPMEAKNYKLHLKKMRTKETILGTTLHGPHRDDLTFLINKKNARTFGSEGQKKTVVMALRFSQWINLKEKIEAAPFFGIDDFEGTLDTERQKYLNEFLQSMGQVFVTTPSQPLLFAQSNLICIEQGKRLLDIK
jgi:DNA replication and repair protein RecF